MKACDHCNYKSLVSISALSFLHHFFSHATIHNSHSQSILKDDWNNNVTEYFWLHETQSAHMY